MRKNVPAAALVEWIDTQVWTATQEINQPHKAQQTINRLNGRIEALIEVKNLLRNLTD